MKIKAKIYQYTGIFLAKKEEAAYLASDEATQRANMYEECGLPRDLVVGEWQSGHGFYRHMSLRFFMRARSSKFYRLCEIVDVFYLQLKSDILG